MLVKNFFIQTFYSDMFLLIINKSEIEKSTIENNTILPLDIIKKSM